MNGCEHYKVGQFQLRKASLVLLTHSLVSTFKYLKNLLLTIQMRVLSRVVLVWCFYDHKSRHGVMFRRRGATRKNTI